MTEVSVLSLQEGIRDKVSIKLQDQVSIGPISVDDPDCNKYEVGQIPGHRDGPTRVTGIYIWIRCQNHHGNVVPVVGVISRSSELAGRRLIIIENIEVEKVKQH